MSKPTKRCQRRISQIPAGIQPENHSVYPVCLPSGWKAAGRREQELQLQQEKEKKKDPRPRPWLFVRSNDPTGHIDISTTTLSPECEFESSVHCAMLQWQSKLDKAPIDKDDTQTRLLRSYPRDGLGV
ncbi:hypothetical protein ACLKA7_007253 [Drosophila subpalustris]